MPAYIIEEDFLTSFTDPLLFFAQFTKTIEGNVFMEFVSDTQSKYEAALKGSKYFRLGSMSCIVMVDNAGNGFNRSNRVFQSGFINQVSKIHLYQQMKKSDKENVNQVILDPFNRMKGLGSSIATAWDSNNILLSIAMGILESNVETPVYTNCGGERHKAVLIGSNVHPDTKIIQTVKVQEYSSCYKIEN